MAQINLLSENAAVLLNGKIIRTALTADDDEGWVEIPDIAAMAPLNTEASLEMGEEDVLEAHEKLITKKIYGKVEIKRIPNQ